MTSLSIKRRIIDCLWDNYVPSIPYYKIVFNENKPVIDHLAIIDLPSSECTGIPFMRSIFTRLGFIETGAGYLPEKQNDFIWMTDKEANLSQAKNSLPQVVLADFRINLLPSKVQKIVQKYVNQAQPFNFSEFDKHIESGDEEKAVKMLSEFLLHRSWGLPTVGEYNIVKEENQLLAWVLLFGRKVNHFGVNITFETSYTDLWHFNSHIKTLNYAELNSKEGEVKGGAHQGIAQSSTLGQYIKIKAADGFVETHNSFMEFVWRYPKTKNAKMWGDYFTGFVAENANKVIESLYDDQSNK